MKEVGTLPGKMRFWCFVLKIGSYMDLLANISTRFERKFLLIWFVCTIKYLCSRVEGF